jgi:predicted metal-dependent hydrolase
MMSILDHIIEVYLSPKTEAPRMVVDKKLRVMRSKRARRVALRLDHKARVMNLVVPRGMHLDTAFQFAIENKQWIKDKLGELPEPVPFEHGAILPIMNVNYRLNIYHDPDMRSTDIVMSGKNIYVVTNKEDPSKKVISFLKKLAEEKLGELTREKAKLVRRKVSKFTVRDTSSRWGSCAEDGEICLSWRLLFAPQPAMDYVIAHEVAHLRHLHHEKSFWELCRELSDDYLEGRYWVDNHGHELMRYGAEEE